MSYHHYWIRAGRRRDRADIRRVLDLPPVLATCDAHRRLRGPYTAAGALLRAIGDDVLARCPELGVRHNVAILTCAPEFRGRVPEMGTALELAAAPGQRTRFHARLHTLRIAHSLTDLLRGYLAALGDGPRTLIVEDVHEADPSDREFLAVLLRRIGPELLTVVIGTDAGDLVDPPGPVPASLVHTLSGYAERVDGAPTTEAAVAVADSEVQALAQTYVDSDGTSDDPRQLVAYQRLSPPERARLHDARAAHLVAEGSFAVLLGAVPYHAEHGSDPAGAGVDAVWKAQLHCRDMGIYHAAADLGARGRRLIDRRDQPRRWWGLTAVMATALSSAGRAVEAEEIYAQERGLSTDPLIHMNIAYEMAMLYTRHHEDGRRDHQVARCWLNLAIAIASVLEDPKERLFYSVFNRNGLALVEVRQGRPEEALRLVNEGMERLEREASPGEYALHRIGLRYNRAQVYGMTGRLEEALADYDAVIAADEGVAHHYFNRGNILRRLGRMEQAIADYDRAIALSPPFPEVHYNRGDAALELGDARGALADFSRAIELDAEHVDALLNRAGILADLGEEDAAWRDIEAGLALERDHVQLLCLKGRLLAERGDGEAARAALSAALRIDDGLAEAWAIRGMVAYDAADHLAAIGDLDRAIALDDNPDFRFNRAIAHEAAGHFAEAVADYDAVLAATGDADALRRRDTVAATAKTVAA